MVVSEVRRRTMQAVRSTHTGPEIIVRKVLSQNGYRYRLNRADLIGKPDIVFVGRKKAIFVNGCFWHGHTCARGSRVPENNQSYWLEKISKNRRRDVANLKRLGNLGWQVLVIWECQIKDLNALGELLKNFLETTS